MHSLAVITGSAGTIEVRLDAHAQALLGRLDISRNAITVFESTFNHAPNRILCDLPRLLEGRTEGTDLGHRWNNHAIPAIFQRLEINCVVLIGHVCTSSG
jgi:hypothetical protein